jgi:peptidoglycan hydrolase CwlO-like protein
MKNTLHSSATIVLFASATMAMGQNPAVSTQSRATQTHARRVRQHATAKPSPLADDIRQLREVVDTLRLEVSQRDAEMADMKQKIDSLEHRSEETTAASKSVTDSIEQNDTIVGSLKDEVTKLQNSSSKLDTQVRQVAKTTLTTQKVIENPTSIRYKGVTITPGGFFAGEAVWRQRALNADIYTNWNGQPYPGSGEAHTSEFFPPHGNPAPQFS